MDLGKLKASISLDSAQFERAMKGVLDKLSSLAGSSSKTASGLRTAKRAMTDYQAGLLQTVATLNELLDVQADEIASLKKMGKSTAEAEAKFNALADQLAFFTNEQKKAISATKKLNDSKKGLLGTIKQNILSFDGLKRSLTGVFVGLVAFNQGVYFLQNTFNILWRLVEGVGGAFLDAASKAEQFRMRMQSALGSASAGSKLYDMAAQYATTVPFMMQEVLESATSLAPIIRNSADEIMGWLPMISDLAALTGLTLKEATGNFIKMFSAGAAAADLFRERGILPLLGFLPKVSYSVAETRAQLEKMKPLLEGTSARLAYTLEGQIGMIKDKWFNLRTMLMNNGPFDFIKGVIYQLNVEFGEFISKFETDAPSVGAKVTAMLKSFLTGLLDLAQGLINVFNQVKPVLLSIASSISAIWSTYSSMPTWMQEVGLIGALFFGWEGKALLGAMLAATGYVKTLASSIEMESHVQNALKQKLITPREAEVANRKDDTWIGGGKNTIALLKSRGYSDPAFLQIAGDAGDKSGQAYSNEFLESIRKALSNGSEVGALLKADLDFVNPVESFFDLSATKEQMAFLDKLDMKMEQLDAKDAAAGMSDYTKEVAKARAEYVKLLEDARKLNKDPDAKGRWIKDAESKVKNLSKDLQRTKDATKRESLLKAIKGTMLGIENAKNSPDFANSVTSKAAEYQAAKLKLLKDQFIAAKDQDTSKLRRELELIGKVDLSDTARQLAQLQNELDSELAKHGKGEKDERAAITRNFDVQKAKVLAQATADVQKRIISANDSLSQVGLSGVSAEFASVTLELGKLRDVVDPTFLGKLDELEKKLTEVTFAKKEDELAKTREEISLIGIRNKYLKEEAQARIELNRALSQAARLKNPDSRSAAEKLANEEYALTLEKIRAEKAMDAHETDSWVAGAKLGFEELKEATYSWGEVSKATVTGVASSMSDTFSNIFVDAAKGDLKSLEEYALDMLGNIVKAMSDAIAQKMAYSIAGGMGSMFGFARGGVFSGGNVTPFARGGVVTRPTIFPFASGIGLMGEAGAEAIMPLTRLPSGDLGVKASLTGGAQQVSVSIFNESGQQMQVSQSSASTDDMGRTIVEVWIDAHVNNKYGLRDYVSG